MSFYAYVQIGDAAEPPPRGRVGSTLLIDPTAGTRTDFDNIVTAKMLSKYDKSDVGFTLSDTIAFLNIGGIYEISFGAESVDAVRVYAESAARAPHRMLARGLQRTDVECFRALGYELLAHPRGTLLRFCSRHGRRRGVFAEPISGYVITALDSEDAIQYEQTEDAARALCKSKKRTGVSRENGRFRASSGYLVPSAVPDAAAWILT